MIKSVLQLRRPFSSWKPKVPKHWIVIDKQSYRMAHPVWSLQDAETIDMSHQKPKGLKDRVALNMMKLLRSSFDLFSGYRPGKMTEERYLRRFIFLETIAGVPGMVGAMLRHLRELRTMTQDNGWIHHLLEEAENERMHLFTFIQQKEASRTLRLAVLGAQGVFIAGYSSLYLLSPKTAHRFVGYLEEEAVKTYTACLKDLDAGKLPRWSTLPAPDDAKRYWYLSEDATFRDVLISVRADESMHREVNHHLADLEKGKTINGHEYHVFEKASDFESLRQVKGGTERVNVSA